MRMELAYTYAGTRGSRVVRGTVYASSRTRAAARLRRMNVKTRTLRLAPLRTLDGWLSPEFRPFELEAFYTYLARVSERGGNRAAMLGEVAGLVEDERLKFAIALVRDAVQEGQPLGKAMLQAGFPERDARLVETGEEGGKLGTVLHALAREVRREADLKRAMNRVLRSPIVVAVAAYILTYLALTQLAPRMAAKFEEANNLFRLPEYATAYYSFVKAFNAQIYAATAIYLAIGVGIFAFFRSRMAKALFEGVLPTLRKLREFAEASQLWGAYSLMSDSGVDRYRIARALAKASWRKVTRDRFARLERQFRLGVDFHLAVERAAFPRYVIDGVRAAVLSHSVPEGTRDLADRLGIQTSILTERIAVFVNAVAAMLGAVLVLAFVAVTLLPQLSAVLSSG